MKKTLLTIATFLSCNLLNAGGMPERELDNISDYKAYINMRIGRVDDAIDELLEDIAIPKFNSGNAKLLNDEDLAKYTLLIGMKEAYYDCLFWVDMIGKAIPMD